MTLKTTRELAKRMPKPEKHDIITYRWRGITSSSSVTKVESRGAMPSVNNKELEYVLIYNYFFVFLENINFIMIK